MTVGVEREKKVSPTSGHRVVRIHSDDSVAVAVDPLEPGDRELWTSGVTRHQIARAVCADTSPWGKELAAH